MGVVGFLGEGWGIFVGCGWERGKGKGGEGKGVEGVGEGVGEKWS